MVIRYTVYKRKISVGGGQPVPNRNSWDVDAVAESRDMVGGSDEVDEAYGELLGRPSVLSPVNRGMLAPSACSITSQYSSSLISPEVFSKSTTARGADAGFGINKLPPSQVDPRRSPSLYRSSVDGVDSLKERIQQATDEVTPIEGTLVRGWYLARERLTRKV